MKRLTAAFLLAFAGAAAAQDWISPDPRSKATGNAGVAYAEGINASYWNPSLTALDAEKMFDFSTRYGFAFTTFADATIVGDVISKFNRLSDIVKDTEFGDVQDALNSGTFTATDVQSALKVVDAVTALQRNDEGALLHAGGGLDFQFGPFGLFARPMVSAGIIPHVDFTTSMALSDNALNVFFGNLAGPVALSPEGIALSTGMQAAAPALAGDADTDGIVDADELAYQAQLALGDAAISNPAFVSSMNAVAAATAANAGGAEADTLYNNPSGFDLRAVLQTETGVSLGIPLKPQVLTVGIALKEIITESSFTRVRIQESSEEDDPIETAQDDFDANRKRSNDFNVDLGVLYSPADWARVGLTARNIFPMEIPIAGPDDRISMKPQYRLGAAVSPIGLLNFGLDVDLSKNDSPFFGSYSSQMIGGGMEVDLSFLKLRGGLFDNIAESGGFVYTGGFGLKIFFLCLDFSGQMSSDRVKIEESDSEGSGKNYPEGAGAAASISIDLRF